LFDWACSGIFIFFGIIVYEFFFVKHAEIHSIKKGFGYMHVKNSRPLSGLPYQLSPEYLVELSDA
jgi:hypothetical protein